MKKLIGVLFVFAFCLTMSLSPVTAQEEDPGKAGGTAQDNSVTPKENLKEAECGNLKECLAERNILWLNDAERILKKLWNKITLAEKKTGNKQHRTERLAKEMEEAINSGRGELEKLGNAGKNDENISLMPFGRKLSDLLHKEDEINKALKEVIPDETPNKDDCRE